MLTTMENLAALLLEHPERFTWSEIPCCLLGLWESATMAVETSIPSDPLARQAMCSKRAPPSGYAAAL